MNQIKFSTEDGKILLNGKTIAPLSLSDFRKVANDGGINFSEFTPTAEWKTIGIDVIINSQPFSMNISYRENDLQVCWFDWGGGVSFIKGYDTSESELITDKNSLTKIISKILSKEPDEKKYNNDNFLYGWGHISLSASIQSVIVSLGVAWRKIP